MEADGVNQIEKRFIAAMVCHVPHSMQNLPQHYEWVNNLMMIWPASCSMLLCSVVVSISFVAHILNLDVHIVHLKTIQLI